MTGEKQHHEKGKAYSGELGLNWKSILNASELDPFILAETLEWIWENRLRLRFKKFRQQIDDLYEVKEKERLNAFINLGFSLPQAVAVNFRLFSDFYCSLTTILDMIPHPKDSKRGNPA